MIDLVVVSAVIRIVMWLLLLGGGFVYRRPATIIVGAIGVVANILLLDGEKGLSGLLGIVATGVIVWLLIDRLERAGDHGWRGRD